MMEVTVRELISLSKIPLAVYKKSGVHSLFNPARYAELFKRFTDNKKAYRIYIPYKAHASKVVDKQPPQEIVDFLAQKGWGIDNYQVGMAIDAKGRRKKIGKILVEEPSLLKKFENDPARAGSNLKAAKMLVCISRHPYDLAGMSFDRGWTSCMNIEVGSNKRFVNTDIKHGVLIAYLIDVADKNINKPKARCRIYPFTGTKKDLRFVPETKVYGIEDEGFINTVQQWCEDVNPQSMSVEYRRYHSIYYDEVLPTLAIIKNIGQFKRLDPRTSLVLDKNFDTGSVVKAIKKLSKQRKVDERIDEEFAITRLLSKMQPTPDIIQAITEYPTEEMIFACLKYTDVSYPTSFYESVWKFADDNVPLQSRILRHPHCSLDFLALLKDSVAIGNITIGRTILGRLDTTQEMYRIALKGRYEIRRVALKNARFSLEETNDLWDTLEEEDKLFLLVNPSFPTQLYPVAYTQLGLTAGRLLIEKLDLPFQLYKSICDDVVKTTKEDETEIPDFHYDHLATRILRNKNFDNLENLTKFRILLCKELDFAYNIFPNYFTEEFIEYVFVNAKNRIPELREPIRDSKIDISGLMKDYPDEMYLLWSGVRKELYNLNHYSSQHLQVFATDIRCAVTILIGLSFLEDETRSAVDPILKQTVVENVDAFIKLTKVKTLTWAWQWDDETLDLLTSINDPKINALLKEGKK